MTNLKKILYASLAVIAIVIYFEGDRIWTYTQQTYYKVYFDIKTGEGGHSGSRVDTVKFHSAALNRDMTYAVYVPVGYENSTSSYPVLYLLHGNPGNFRDWIVNADLPRIANDMIWKGDIKPFLVVTVDGNGPVIHAGQYVNATTVKQDMETYVSGDVVRSVDSRYRTIPSRQGRAIGGNSSGGYGAVNIGLKHNDEFSTILVFGGYFDNWHDELDGVFGQNQAAIASNSPMQYLANEKINPNTHILLAVGSKDTASLLKENREFADILSAKHISYSVIETPGRHMWLTWKKLLPEALSYYSNHISSK